MAPTAPKKRPSIRSKTSKSTSTSTSTATTTSGSGLISRPTSLSSNSKRDKRTIKSSLFKHRIEKTHSTPTSKRRRPSKKLVSNLDSLADALPDIEEMSGGRTGMAAVGKIKMDSLTSGKGLMRRREKVEVVERERFGRNLGLLMGSMGTSTTTTTSIPSAAPLVEGEGLQTAQAQPSATAKRFQALRAWIGETIDKDGAFEGK
ncbi:hypothetical protein LOCC1_G006204 [Lachnellula occidentalis]|uniref:Ribosome biogenesis protein SLX9 n=1 Tax=Lachnellula occidentalis TaxID=215460 RepID=A0A8H8RUX2_9HELO|nr:hypothetical protein LOCC1_G006204 [Lachnellula occidentalis]